MGNGDMQLERDFIERRRLERRAAINAGIVALIDRRDRERRGDNSRIADWLARFHIARAGK